MTKPKILCLHGSGTNARIFEAQTARLGTIIRKHFDLVFPEGPIVCEAGPGVLPFFEGEEPFRRWHQEVDAQARNAAHARQMERVRELLLRVVREQGPFAGVLGFSQGAKTALELLLLQEERPGEFGVGGTFKFGVLACGTVPAYDLLFDRRAEGEERAKELLVRVPTLHVIADADPWREQSEQMPAYCAEHARRSFRFKGGHHLPNVPAENQALADAIIKMHREAEAASA